MSDLSKHLREQAAIFREEDSLGRGAKELEDAAELIEQQAARIAELEALLVKANDAWLAMSKTATVAPAVDAQPVAIVTETHDSRGKPDLYTIMATSKLRIGDRLYSSAQLEGLRKDAERYRWLRAAYTRVVAMPEQGPNLDMVAIGEIGDSLESSALDAAIDACLKRTRSD